MEISIPVGAAGAELAGDRSHRQRWARAAAKREARLNWFVCFVALGEWAGNASGTLSFLWATVVLLGGFCTALNQEDFWFPTVMIFIESFRLFSSSYRLDHQSLFGTTRAVKLVIRSINLVFMRPQELNEVVAIVILFFNLAMQFQLPWGGVLIMLVGVPIIFASKIQFSGALQLTSFLQRHRRLLLWALLVALLLIAGLRIVGRIVDKRPVRLAYQPPASSTFLSEQISHQQPASSTFLSEQTSTSHQPPAKRTG